MRFQVRVIETKEFVGRWSVSNPFDLADLVDAECTSYECEYAPDRKNMTDAIWKPVVPEQFYYIPGMQLIRRDVTRDGLAVMQIGRETLIVDTTRYRVGENDRVVRFHPDGRLTVGSVLYDVGYSAMGRRGAAEEWRLMVQGDPSHVVRGRIRDHVAVLGAVIDP